MEDVSFAAAFMMQNDNLTGCFGPLRDQYINYNLRIGKEAAGDARTVQGVKFSLSAPWEQSGGVELVLHSNQVV